MTKQKYIHTYIHTLQPLPSMCKNTHGWIHTHTHRYSREKYSIVKYFEKNIRGSTSIMNSSNTYKLFGLVMYLGPQFQIYRAILQVCMNCMVKKLLLLSLM